MHNRLYVLVNKEEIKNPDEVRNYVYNYLDESGFASEGRFSGGYSDGYSIGGRWSGGLTKLMLDQDLLKKFYDECEKEKLFYSSDDEKIRRLQIQAKFMKYFPKYRGHEVIWRNNQCNDLGAEDDAQLITKELWEGIKAQAKSEQTTKEEFQMWEGIDSNIISTDSDLEECDLLEREKDIIGKFYICVVDYHC